MAEPPPMIKPTRKAFIMPLLVTSFGLAWLLKQSEIAPSVDWIWAIFLAVIGVLIPLVIGLDKVTIVLGPGFLVACCLSLLRQSEKLKPDLEVPILVVAIGILMLIALLPTIPKAKWIANKDE